MEKKYTDVDELSMQIMRRWNHKCYLLNRDDDDTNYYSLARDIALCLVGEEIDN